MEQAREGRGTDRTGVGRRAVLLGTAAAGLGALVAACSSAPTTPPAASPPPAAPAPPPGLPQSAALRAQFEQAAKDLLTPGAALLVRSSAGELAVPYGSRTDTGTEPVTLADHARIGSITKTFTGTVILQLAQEGRLDIDAPVSELRPDVPNGRNITLAQLLDMRSGLYNYSQLPALNRSLDENPGKVWTPEELLALGLSQPVSFAPGTTYEYSNTNIVLLGLIAEQVEKRPLGESYQARLFTPLGMRETSFPAGAAIPAPHPRGYMYGTNMSTLETEALPPDQQAAARAGTLKPNDVTDASPSWTWAAGGAIATVGDLATWARALTDGTLLNPAWQRRRLESVQSTDPSKPTAAGYGLGIAKFGPMYGHTGELPGFQSFAGHDPDRGITLTVWTNLKAAPDGNPPAATIAQQLIGTIYA